MITYVDRYSSTDLPDIKGRWARIAVFRDIQIAWITKHVIQEKYTYLVENKFPTMYNDSSTETKVCDSLQEAKDFVEERWEWFINQVK